MSLHDDRLRLKHMRDHIAEAIEMTKDQRRSDLNTDRKLNLALVRLVEIVGEAANRVSSEIQAQCSAIPWAQIVGLRNRLIHGYDEVDFDILWQIIKNDLPPLIKQLDGLIDKLEKEQGSG